MNKKFSSPLSVVTNPKKQTVASDDVLDSIADQASFGGRSETGCSTKSSSVSVNTLIIDGHEIIMDAEVSLPDSLVTEIFSGNKRNKRNLGDIESLAESIIGAGRNTEPVKLRPLADRSGLELIKGRRRLAAVIRANQLSDTPIMLNAIVTNIDDKQATLEAALENFQRKDLNIWERADQLQELLETGACRTMDELTQHLPSSNKKKDRSLAYYYLNPAKISKQVRQYIDEDASATLKDVKKLKEGLGKLNEPKGYYQHLADLFSLANATIKELNDSLEKFLAPKEAKKDNSGTYNVKNKQGKNIATVTIAPDGGGSLRISKTIPQDTVLTLMMEWEEKLKEIKTG